jgi:hypothetical protein
METQKKTDTAQVILVVDEDGVESKPVEKEVSAGPTLISTLKAELGVPEAAILWLIEGQKRTPFDNSETIDVRSGMHFEAIEGGGIS